MNSDFWFFSDERNFQIRSLLSDYWRFHCDVFEVSSERVGYLYDHRSVPKVSLCLHVSFELMLTDAYVHVFGTVMKPLTVELVASGDGFCLSKGTRIKFTKTKNSGSDLTKKWPSGRQLPWLQPLNFFFFCALLKTMSSQQSRHHTAIANKYTSIVHKLSGDLNENHFRHSLCHFNYTRNCTLLQKLS